MALTSSKNISLRIVGFLFLIALPASAAGSGRDTIIHQLGVAAHLSARKWLAR
jgi:hypothetical protein